MAELQRQRTSEHGPGASNGEVVMGGRGMRADVTGRMAGRMGGLNGDRTVKHVDCGGDYTEVSL